MQLIIDTANTNISVRNKAFYIENKTVSRIISPKRISSLAIIVNCNINASAIKLAAQWQIPIYFYNNFGTLQARMCSPFMVNLANLRRKQLLFYNTKEATQWVMSIIEMKTRMQINHLNQLANRKTKFKKLIGNKTDEINNILLKLFNYENLSIEQARAHFSGIEGSIARIYFQTLRNFMPKLFEFSKRSRRPANDFFNAGLNYLYGMTYSIVETAIYAKGLDPFNGFMHSENYRKPNLVYDIIEPVRPVIDKMWVQLILSGQAKAEHFVKKEQGIWLNKAGKRMIIPSFNHFLKKRFKKEGKFFSLKDFIFTLSNDLGNLINTTILD